MERQLQSNIQSLLKSQTDSQPSTSRPGGSKIFSKPNYNKGRDNGNGQLYRNNASTRYSNKTRNRELSNLNETAWYPKVHDHKCNKKIVKLSVKERFVQANCQFMLNESSDRHSNQVDPDAPLDWDLVEQILFTGTNSEELCCPICLCPPIAAKITRCGHIYCWSCILHYLALSDEQSRSCPICFENIQEKKLKSVLILKKVDFVANTFMTFTLMKAPKGGISAIPITCDKISESVADPETAMFTKQFVASFDDLLAILDREQAELSNQWTSFQLDNMPEICFVQKALDEVHSRREMLQRMKSVTQESSIDLSLFTKGQSSVQDYVYFYQSEDGQNIYLNNLNVRMLKQEYGEIKNGPTSITAKIIELHRETVSEELRKRFNYIRHLPLSCEFKIAEVEFDSSIIGDITRQSFEAEVSNRKRNRQRKEKAQKLRDRHIDIENNKRIHGIYPDPEFKLNNENDFPEWHGIEVDNSNKFPAISPDTSDPIRDTIDLDASADGLQSSFANMLSTGSSSFYKYPKSRNIAADATPTIMLEGDNSIVTPIANLNLGDYFDTCIKTKVSKKNRKKK